LDIQKEVVLGKVRYSFSMLDSDKTGFVSNKDVIIWMKKVFSSRCPNFSQEDWENAVQSFINCHDLDNDGKLDMQEWIGGDEFDDREITILPFVKFMASLLPEAGVQPKDHGKKVVVTHEEPKRDMSLLLINLHSGNKLKPMDSNGLSDPYVVTTCGKFTHKSKVIKKSLSPTWEESIEITKTQLKAGGNIINFEVFDEDLVKDDRIGSVSMKFTEETYDFNVAKTHTLSVHDKENTYGGEIKLSFTKK